MARSSNFFIRWSGNILGVLFFLTIILLLFSFFKFLYFPSRPSSDSRQQAMEKFSMGIDQPLGAEHFHILDSQQYADRDNAPLCLKCHGNYCHEKSEKFRSFYNMHTFYLACETCHIRVPTGESVSFSWFDDQSGKKLAGVRGEPGRYGAKIVPVKAGKRLDDFPQKQLALDYLRHESTYSQEEKEAVQKKLMSHISENALTCGECHKKDGYLDFDRLGYSRLRKDKLANLEILQLIEEYDNFYLPTMFDPEKASGSGNVLKNTEAP